MSHPRSRVRLIAGLAVGLAAATAPALAAPPGQSTAGRTVNAVVVVRPGVQLPLQVAGGRVLHVFSSVGSELVRAPMSSLAALAADARVAGVTPDRSGRVAGYIGKKDKKDGGPADKGVFASDHLGGGAGNDKTGQGVNVAMLDTGLTDTEALNRASGRVTDGVDVSHLAAGGDAVTSPPPGGFTDGYGHGTFLASLIAGGKVKGVGGHAIGVAPAARIVVVKVANDQGETTLSEVLAGMDWVAAHAQGPNGQQMIQVLNIALAVNPPTGPTTYGADPLTAAVEKVRSKGVLVVAASGNTANQVGDPGMDPQALTIGAADITSGRPTVAPFSGSGIVAGVQKPDVVASGVHVLGMLSPDSEIAKDNPQGWQDNGLFRGSGTSEATAIASGVAAGYFSDHPGASVAQAKAALRDSVNGDIRDNSAGAGLVQMVNGSAKKSSTNLGESGFDSGTWQANAWRPGFDWVSLLASSWSASSWSASSWSASSWSASSWSASSWSASSWSASSWSASSWSASSWSASSWSASSWSDYEWGDG